MINKKATGISQWPFCFVNIVASLLPKAASVSLLVLVVQLNPTLEDGAVSQAHGRG